MAVCDVCGNDYDRTFEVSDSSGRRMVFDTIECAAHRLSPVCGHCGCRVLGHGVEAEDTVFCCAHCARSMGISGVADNAVARA